ncbi:MAG: RNase adaptor protein RapZ, partial [Lachnospiraceae bacterium]|nr:RNase adaptor protein RapZ [Lachnospiraceae bacterium]
MRLVVVSGMSGAGKSSVLKFLEDASYYCIDNLPISLIKPFVELSFHGKSELNKVAI